MFFAFIPGLLFQKVMASNIHIIKGRFYPRYNPSILTAGSVSVHHTRSNYTIYGRENQYFLEPDNPVFYLGAW